MKFYKDVLWVTLYQIPLTPVDWSKNISASGLGKSAITQMSDIGPSWPPCFMKTSISIVV